MVAQKKYYILINPILARYLKDVIKNIRKRIIELGGEVRFNSKVTDFRIEDGRIKGVFVNGENYLLVM